MNTCIDKKLDSKVIPICMYTYTVYGMHTYLVLLIGNQLFDNGEDVQ